MATVNFTTIPWEPQTQPIKHTESHIFALFVPVLLCMLGLKVLLFLYVFMSFVKVFEDKCTSRHLFSF